MEELNTYIILIVEVIEDNNFFCFADFTAALKINSLKSYIQPCNDNLVDHCEIYC